MLREAGVLATWEDELWLELRDLFTSEIKSSFDAQPSLKELLMSKIASAVERVEKSVAWYEGGQLLKFCACQSIECMPMGQKMRA